MGQLFFDPFLPAGSIALAYIFAAMQLIEVTDKATARRFISINVALNSTNPRYIRPLDKDIEEVFDEKKNKAFRFGKAKRWLLLNERGEGLGRIAAFVNKKYKNRGDEGPVGGIGFFDCVNNQEAADMLFDVARHWLLAEGMTAMDGPINFGERDRWWGLVVEGFQEPLYCMNYNPPYYRELFETYGFQPFFHQICFGMRPKEPLSRKVTERHAFFEKDPAYVVSNLERNRLEEYAADFTTVYNAAWAGHGGLKELKKEQVVIMFKKMLPVMDEKILWFAYHQDRPIGIFINLPDLNQWFRHLNGGFSLLHKLKFLWVKKTKKCTKFTGLVFGIVPEYQGKGIDAFIVGEAYKTVVNHIYDDYEMQWIGDFNPKMLNVAEGLGDVHQSRRLTTYRYLFDRTKKFERHPILA
jgi:GNAT superfamily N-acetyltransferase